MKTIKSQTEFFDLIREHNLQKKYALMFDFTESIRRQGFFVVLLAQYK